MRSQESWLLPKLCFKKSYFENSPLLLTLVQDQELAGFGLCCLPYYTAKHFNSTVRSTKVHFQHPETFLCQGLSLLSTEQCQRTYGGHWFRRCGELSFSLAVVLGENPSYWDGSGAVPAQLLTVQVQCCILTVLHTDLPSFTENLDPNLQGCKDTRIAGGLEGHMTSVVTFWSQLCMRDGFYLCCSLFREAVLLSKPALVWFLYN